MSALMMLMWTGLVGMVSTASMPHNHPAEPPFTCHYTGTAPAPQVVCNEAGSRSNAHAERVVDRILKPIGLMRNFKIMECANTENCFATVVNGQRYVVYDGSFMQRIEEETETDWSAISIMAHEIGHHLQGHTIDRKGDRRLKELEADKFSGFVLHQLGATLDESLVAVNKLGNTVPTPTHPVKSVRMAAIRQGWLEAEELYPRTARTAATWKAGAPAKTVPTPTAPDRFGCVSGDCADGTGVFVSTTRERYVGEFEEGERHGEGQEFYPDGKLKYKGNFRDNVRSDYGTYFYRNGDKYAGWFAANQPNGKGVYYFADGDRFVGTFRSGRRHGYGVLYDRNGNRREAGQYVADKLVR